MRCPDGLVELGDKTDLVAFIGAATQGRQHDQRHGSAMGQLPDPAGERQSIHFGHLHVEDGGIVLRACCQGVKRCQRRSDRVRLDSPSRDLS
jgi:hypothetical protein